MHILKTNKKSIMFLTLRLRNILLHSMNCSMLLLICISFHSSQRQSHSWTYFVNKQFLIFILSLQSPSLSKLCVCHFASHFFLIGNILYALFCDFFFFLSIFILEIQEVIHFSFPLPVRFHCMTISQCSSVPC